ncbi:MAG: T9SS type A sorting domain-containing protein, partial [bacterium]
TLPNHGQCSTVARAVTDTWTIAVPGVRDYRGPVFSVAGQMSYMDAYIAKYWPSSPYYYNIWMYMTLGDPAMPVWVGTPATPVVSYPDSIPTGQYNLNVDVTVGGQPVAGALVCAWREGEFYVVERTDATGAATLAVSASTPGEVMITVSEGHSVAASHTPILPHEGFTMAGGGSPQPSVRYVGNRVDDSGGNNNGRFDPGETADVIVTVRNNGNAPAENLTGRLRAYHAQFSVTDSTAGFGTLAAGADTNNAHDRFSASAGSGIPGGTSVQCSLYLHSDNWGEWTWGFRLQVGPPPVPAQYIITLDTGAVRLSVCGIGSIGYDEPPADAGSGFQVPKNAASALFFGGLMAGDSESWLVDHHFGQPANGPTNRDWTMTDSFRYQVPAAPADIHWRGAMSDSGHPSAKGLGLTWDWYMTARGGYDDWAVVDIEFSNDGPADITGMYAGFIGDFDIGSSSTNLAASDEARRAVWMRQASSENPCAGFALLNPTTFANLTAVDHDLYVYADSAMTDGMKWRLLNGTIAARQSNRSYDWSVLASAGPFDLARGATQRVAFAVVGGLNVGEFGANVDSAQRWYDANLLGVREGEGRISAGRRPLLLSPNPFSRGTFVHYQLPVAGRVAIAAYDPAGRELERVEFEAAAGSGRYYWQPQALARGVYFLRVSTPGGESVAKVMMLD